MSSDLFRPEAMQARAGQWLGGVRLNTSLPWWGVTVVAVALAGFLVAFSFFAEITQKAHVSGVLMPAGGQLDLHAAAPGRVAELRVAEGQIVREGDVVMVLALDRSAGAGELGAQVARQIETRRAALGAERTLRGAQLRLQQQSLAGRVKAMDAELRRADDEVALANRRLSLTQQQVARVEQLHASGFLSATQAQAQHQDLIEAETRVQQLSRTRIALARDRAALAAEVQQLEAQLQTELAQVDRTLAELTQEAAENEGRRIQVITSPRDGTVTLVALAAGHPVQDGQLLASVAPAGAPLQAHLFAPSRTVGFAAVGQQVQLRLAAFPYQKFGLQAGRVAAVSLSPVAPAQLPAAQAHLANATNVSEGLYRLTVDLASQYVVAYGEATPLRSGMTVDAAVIKDRRRVIEWILEPLFALSA